MLEYKTYDWHDLSFDQRNSFGCRDGGGSLSLAADIDTENQLDSVKIKTYFLNEF